MQLKKLRNGFNHVIELIMIPAVAMDNAVGKVFNKVIKKLEGDDDGD